MSWRSSHPAMRTGAGAATHQRSTWARSWAPPRPAARRLGPQESWAISVRANQKHEKRAKRVSCPARRETNVAVCIARSSVPTTIVVASRLAMRKLVGPLFVFVGVLFAMPVAAQTAPPPDVRRDAHVSDSEIDESSLNAPAEPPVPPAPEVVTAPPVSLICISGIELARVHVLAEREGLSLRGRFTRSPEGGVSPPELGCGRARVHFVLQRTVRHRCPCGRLRAQRRAGRRKPRAHPAAARRPRRAHDEAQVPRSIGAARTRTWTGIIGGVGGLVLMIVGAALQPYSPELMLTGGAVLITPIVSPFLVLNQDAADIEIIDQDGVIRF